LTEAKNEEMQQQIRQARGKFAAMVATYSLGVFNDNFFKQAACLMAIYAGRDTLQGIAAAVFTIPWLLFAAPAGWLADRFSKHSVVIAAKLLELAAMICGAIGIVTGIWGLILAMLFLMGLQSTIFSPALNGSIPELYPAEYVLRANSTVKVVTTSSILIGIILAGVALGHKLPSWGSATLGQVIVAIGVVGIAALGVIVSLGVPRRPAADPRVVFPWSGPLDTIRRLWRMRADKLLSIVLLADAFVWFVAALQVLIINKLGKALLNLDERGTSYLVVSELVGVAIGGLLVRRIVSDGRWYRILAPAMGALALLMVLMIFVPSLPAAAQVPGVIVLLVGAGLAGGVLLVPLEAFFQVRPPPNEKGSTIAAANFAGFFGILLAGLASIPLNLWLAPAVSFAAVGGLAVFAALWLYRLFSKEDLA